MPTTPEIIDQESKHAYLNGALAVGLAHGLKPDQVLPAATKGWEKAAAARDARVTRLNKLTELCHNIGGR